MPIVYNVEVKGHLVWIEWTRNKAEAMGELMAWKRIGYNAKLVER
jgi:hypothetical protein